MDTRTLVSVVILIGLLVACGPSEPSESAVQTAIAETEAAASGPTATCTAVPTPTPASSPTPLPVQVASWEGFAVSSVCLALDLSYSPPFDSYDQVIEEAVGVILEGLGIQVADTESSCEATLTISLSGTPLSATYTGGVSCWTGAHAEGQVVLSGPGQATVSIPLDATEGCPYEITGLGCRPMDQAPLDIATATALFDGLKDLWGDQVYIHALRVHFLNMSGVAESKLHPQELDDTEVAILIHLLGDVNRGTRGHAVRLLVQAGPENGVLDALIAATQDEYAEVAGEAIQALGNMGSEEGVVDVLLQALDSEDWTVRASAISALGRIGPEPGVIPALIGLLSDSLCYWDVRSAISGSIPRAKVVSELVRALETIEIQDTQRAIIQILGEMGPEAYDAVPALIPYLDSEESYTLMINATSALEEITGESFGDDADAWREWWGAEQ